VTEWLCRIAITTKGKYTALEAEAVEPLVGLVNDDDSEVRTYTLKVNSLLLRLSVSGYGSTPSCAAATTTTPCLKKNCANLYFAPCLSNMNRFQ